MTGITEDQIEPLCQHLYEAIKRDDDNETAALALQLLSGFLIDVNRIAWFAERIATQEERN
mgnify:CR=1 FL=1